MALYLALSRVGDDARYEVLGKGGDEREAEAEALGNIRDDDPDADALRRNLVVLDRATAEERGLITRGAPAIWYAHLGRYLVEDHGAPQTGAKPTGVTSR